MVTLILLQRLDNGIGYLLENLFLSNPSLRRFFKKLIASLVIVSLLSMNGASCMRPGPEDEGIRGVPRALPFPADPAAGQVGDETPYVLLDDKDPLAKKSLEAGADPDSLALLEGGHKPPSPPSPTLESSLLSGPPGHKLNPQKRSFSLVSLLSYEPKTQRTDLLAQQGWTEDDLTRHSISPDTLAQLLQVEMTWRDAPRWMTVDHMTEKLLYYPLFDRVGISKTDAEKGWTLSPRTWVHGRSIPVRSERTRNYLLAVDGFRQGAEFVIFRGIHLVLSGLLVYQLQQFFNPPSTCLKSPPSLTQNLLSLFNLFQNSEDKGIQGIAHKLAGQTYLQWLLALPLIWGTVKAISNTTSGKPPASEEETRALIQQVSTHTSSFWNDNGRWVFPLHPLSSPLNKLERLLLWEGQASPETREAAFTAIHTLAKVGKGYTQMVALHSLARLAYSVHLKDIGHLAHEPPETQLQLLSMKTRALETLLETAKPVKEKKLASLLKAPGEALNALYSRYLLWTLGQSESRLDSLFLFAFKLAKGAVQVTLLKSIIDNFNEALKCPNTKGYTFAGPQPWVSDYSEQCFNQLVLTFNTFPGQPITDLTNQLGKYHFNSCGISLDLSNKALNGPQVAQILTAFQPYNITITDLNLSGNNLNTPNDFESLKPFLAPLRRLNLANNDIGGLNSAFGWTAIAVLGRTLPFAAHLTDLNLSSNAIESPGSNGTISLAHGLASLSRLKILDLSSNVIGQKDSQGAVALGQSLSSLINLLSLNLYGNFLGAIDPNGIIALAKGLTRLSQLTSLNIGFSRIGFTDDKGAMAKSFKSLFSLTSLDISGNTFRQESIGLLAESLRNLRQLRYFKFFPGDMTYDYLIVLNEALTWTQVKEPLIAFLDPQAITEYLESLPRDTTSIDLSKGRISVPSNQTMTALMQGLRGFTALTSLDLSSNFIEYAAAIILGQELPFLPTLMALDLSENGLEWPTSEGTVALGRALPYLTNLTSLDISSNQIGYFDNGRGSMAIAQGLRNLSRLSSLNLFGSLFGYYDSLDSVTLFQSLAESPYLQYLNLSVNMIDTTDSKATQALGKSLSSHPRLKVLDLSTNNIGSSDSQGTVALGEGISYLNQLSLLDLSYNYIGSTDDKGVKALLESLLPQMVHIDSLGLASMVNISWSEAANNLALFHQAQLKQACENEKCFGSSPQPAQLQASASLQRVVSSGTSSLIPPWPLRILSVPFQYGWPQGMKRLTTSLEPHPMLALSPSLQQSHLPTLYEAHTLPSSQSHSSFWNSAKAYFGFAAEEASTALVKGSEASKALALEEIDPLYEHEPTSTFYGPTLFLTSAWKGATCTFVPALVQDVLSARGVPKPLAKVAATLTHVGTVLYTTSSSATPVLMGASVSEGLAYVGVPAPIATALGSTTAVAMSLGSHCLGSNLSSLPTPTDMTIAVVGGYVGSYIALKAEQWLAGFWRGQKER
jgi:Ran GTPase-activating protein (RanGAP) involved in mRNA processing and transport